MITEFVCVSEETVLLRWLKRYLAEEGVQEGLRDVPLPGVPRKVGAGVSRVAGTRGTLPSPQTGTTHTLCGLV